MPTYKKEFARYQGPRHQREKDKTRYVERMFDDIAGTYDLANKVMSAGLDILWRRRVLKEAGATADDAVLDLCTGTGDVLFEFAKKVPGIRGEGLDLSARMLEIAERKNRWDNLRFRKGNVLRLPWRKPAFKACTMSYGLRSVTDQVKCFKEQKRVLLKGGKALCLELSRPSNPVISALYAPVLKLYVPLMGKLISGHADGYQYLKETIEGFYSPNEILGFMEKAGLKNCRAIPMTFGTATLYIGEA